MGDGVGRGELRRWPPFPKELQALSGSWERGRHISSEAGHWQSALIQVNTPSPRLLQTTVIKDWDAVATQLSTKA